MFGKTALKYERRRFCQKEGIKSANSSLSCTVEGPGQVCKPQLFLNCFHDQTCWEQVCACLARTQCISSTMTAKVLGSWAQMKIESNKPTVAGKKTNK